MKVGMIVMLVAAAAGVVLFPIGSAEATMYVDSEERRSTMFGTFLLLSVMVGALATVSTLMARSSVASEQENEPSSMVVPQIKQESNIVQHIIAA